MASHPRRAAQKVPVERRSDGEHTDRLVTLLDPTAVASEAYRTLRTNLLYAIVDNPPKVILLTSPGQGEGKSTTCANLGVVMSQADKKTIIIDADLRKPVIHKHFGLRNLHGVVDILVGTHSLQEVWWEPIEGLKVVPVGTIPLNPAEILSSRRMSEFLHDLREKFDYVLVDASPIIPVSDPAILAAQVDGVLLVLDAQHTRKVYFRQAIRSLEAVGANVMGTVMNNVNVKNNQYYYNYTTYKY